MPSSEHKNLLMSTNAPLQAWIRCCHPHLSPAGADCVPATVLLAPNPLCKSSPVKRSCSPCERQKHLTDVSEEDMYQGVTESEAGEEQRRRGARFNGAGHNALYKKKTATGRRAWYN